MMSLTSDITTPGEFSVAPVSCLNPNTARSAIDGIIGMKCEWRIQVEDFLPTRKSDVYPFTHLTLTAREALYLWWASDRLLTRLRLCAWYCGSDATSRSNSPWNSVLSDFTWRATERRPIPAPTPPPLANEFRAGAELTAKLSCLVSRWHCHQAASGCRALVQVLYFIERGCERKEGEGKNEGNRRRKVCRAWIKGYQLLTVCLTSRGSAKNDLLKGALWDMMRFLSGWQ